MGQWTLHGLQCGHWKGTATCYSDMVRWAKFNNNIKSTKKFWNTQSLNWWIYRELYFCDLVPVFGNVILNDKCTSYALVVERFYTKISICYIDESAIKIHSCVFISHNISNCMLQNNKLLFLYWNWNLKVCNLSHFLLLFTVSWYFKMGQKTNPKHSCVGFAAEQIQSCYFSIYFACETWTG